MVNEFAEEGAVARVHAVLRDIEQDVPQHKQRMLWNTAIKACSRAGEYEVAVQYFEAMLRNRITPSGRTYGKIIHTAWVAKEYAEAERWAAVMEKSGLLIDPVSLNAILRCAAARDDCPRVWHWLQTFEIKRLEIDTKSVCTLVDFAVRTGNQTMADEWFEKALES